MRKTRLIELVLIVLLLASLACLIIGILVKWSELKPNVPMEGSTEWDIGLWRSSLRYSRPLPPGNCPANGSKDMCNFMAVLGNKLDQVGRDNCMVSCNQEIRVAAAKFDFWHSDFRRANEEIGNITSRNLTIPAAFLVTAAGALIIVALVIGCIAVSGWNVLAMFLAGLGLLIAAGFEIVGLCLAAVWTTCPASNIDGDHYDWHFSHGFDLTVVSTVLTLLALLVFCAGAMLAKREQRHRKRFTASPTPTYQAPTVVSPSFVGSPMPLVQEIPQQPTFISPQPLTPVQCHMPPMMDFGRAASPIISQSPQFMPYM